MTVRNRPLSSARADSVAPGVATRRLWAGMMAPMAIFTDKELEYLKSQLLARVATADSTNASHVVPVGFRLADDGTALEVGGGNVAESKKYRDLKANPKVAIVIDDLASTDPWTPRGIEVRGIAEAYDAGGAEKFGHGWGHAWIRIVPERVTSWGLEGHAPPRLVAAGAAPSPKAASTHSLPFHVAQ